VFGPTVAHTDKFFRVNEVMKVKALECAMYRHARGSLGTGQALFQPDHIIILFMP
jgi:hypothetical protein